MSVDGASRTEILETAARLFAPSGMRTSLKQIADARHPARQPVPPLRLEGRHRRRADRALPDRPRRGGQAGARRPRGDEPVRDKITALCEAIAACGARHRAAVLQSFYEPPSGASDQLVRARAVTPAAIETAMLETLRLPPDRRHPRGHRPRDAGRAALRDDALHQPRGVPRRARRRAAAGAPLPHHARRGGRRPARGRDARPLGRAGRGPARDRLPGRRPTRTRTSGSRTSGRSPGPSSAGEATRPPPSATSPRPPASAPAASTARSARRRSCSRRSWAPS